MSSVNLTRPIVLQVLCIQGFLACRKHADRVLLLVEMMQGSGCPAFKAGARCIHNLRKRFPLSLTETQASLTETQFNLSESQVSLTKTQISLTEAQVSLTCCAACLGCSISSA